MSRLHPMRRLAFAALIAAATPLHAIDAGAELRRHQEEAWRRPAPAGTVPALDGRPTRAAEAAAASEAATHVAGFLVHGVTRFSPAEVEAVLRPYAGRRLDTAGLHAAAQALQSHYRQAGYFAAKVLLPPQTFADVVHMEVLEGYLEADGIEVRNASHLVETDAVQSILVRALGDGQPLHRASMERALLLADDLPGVRVASVLYPGREVGTARLRTVMSDEPRFAGNVDVDNFGNAHTGRHRLGATLYLNSPGRVGDQVVGRIVTAGERSNYGYLAYLRPVSPDGTRVGVSADGFTYESDFIAGLGRSEGSATDLRLTLTHPWIRARHANLHVRAEVADLRLRDRNDLAINGQRNVRSGVLAVYADRSHDAWPGGTSYLDAVLTAGQVDLQGNDAYAAADLAGPQTAGSFTRLNLKLQRLQHLQGPWSAHVRIAGQWANANLDSSQKYYLGGATSLAGFPTGEAGGDDALELHVELRRELAAPWGGRLHASLFWQQGWLRLHKDPWLGWQGTNTTLDNQITLRSAGLGAVQNWDGAWVVRALVGWQLGSNPVRDPVSGTDSDGSARGYRAWLQAIRYF